MQNSSVHHTARLGDVSNPAQSGAPSAALSEYITNFGGGTEVPVSVLARSQCAECGGTSFWMRCSEEEGVAQRMCTGCKRTDFIGDSEEHWAKADVGDATCPCGKQEFEVGVGFCVDAEGDVNWMIVGAACLACGEPGVYADWCIDYTPNKQLLDQT
jgi:hypothetical protein